MHWTFEARKYLEEAQWPTTKRDLIDYLVSCTEAPDELIVTLRELEVDEDEEFANIDEMWPEVPKISDFKYYLGDDDE